MSIPISRIGHSMIGAGALWVLAGCGLAGETLAPRAVSLAEDFVVLGAPGYCADLGTLDLLHDPQVVLFGSCAALKGQGVRIAPAEPGLVTVAVTDAPVPAPSSGALELFLGSTAGRAKMSRSGNAETVRILQTRKRNGVLMLHLRDSSPGNPPGTLPDVWRAMMTVEGRLVSISILSFEQAPMTSDLAFALLEAQCDRIRQANQGS